MSTRQGTLLGGRVCFERHTRTRARQPGVIGYTLHILHALGWEANVIKGKSRYPLSPLDRLRIRKRPKKCCQPEKYGIHTFDLRVVMASTK